MITLILVLLLLIFGGFILAFLSIFSPLILVVGVFIAIDIIVGKAIFKKKKKK